MVLLLSMLLVFSLPLSSSRHMPTVEGQQAAVSIAAVRHAEYHKLSAHEAKAQLDQDQDIKLVDVRTAEEYRDKHIANSILIPDYDVEKLAPEMLSNKDAKIFVYCRSGRRSRGAAMKLVEMGYTNVYDIGGIIDWPYETVAGE